MSEKTGLDLEYNGLSMDVILAFSWSLDPVISPSEVEWGISELLIQSLIDRERLYSCAEAWATIAYQSAELANVIFFLQDEY